MVGFGASAIALGLVLMAQITTTTSYFPHVFIAMMIIASGAISNFVALSLTIMGRIAPQDSGAASGLMQTNQQVGGAIGLAVLVTVFTTVSRGSVESGHDQLSAMVDGMQRGFLTAAGIAVVVLLIAIFGLRSPKNTEVVEADASQAVMH